MRRFIGLCGSVLLIATIAGCGTIANMKGGYVIGPRLEGYPAPYGGVQLDTQRLRECGHDFTSNPLSAGLCSLILLADMPISVVGDTVTLPWLLAPEGEAREETLPRGIVPAGGLTPSTPR